MAEVKAISKTEVKEKDFMSQVINKDTKWSLSGSPYTIRGTLTVLPNITLTIKPGVLVRFENSGYYPSQLIIQGSLNAKGQKDRKIIFSSTSKKSIRWNGIKFTSESKKSYLSFVEIKNAVQGVETHTSSLTIKNSTLQDNKTGIYIKAASPLIESNSILRNDTAIYLENSSGRIIDNLLQNNNKYGIHGINHSSPTIKNNRFKGNVSYAILLDTSSSGTLIKSNEVRGNYPVVYILGGNTGKIISNKRWTSDTPYVIGGPITIEKDATLTIKEGTIIKFDSFGYYLGQIIVNGTILAKGTKKEAIIFTSIHDDSVGGDSKNDGGKKAPSPRNWSGIKLNEESTNNILHHVVIKYAGKGVEIHSESVSIRRTTFSDNNYGIWAETATPNISLTSFINNNEYSLYNHLNKDIINVENNFWNNINGPAKRPKKGEKEESQKNNFIGKRINASPWLTYDPNERIAPRPTALTYIDPKHMEIAFSEEVKGAESLSAYSQKGGMKIFNVEKVNNTHYKLRTSHMLVGKTYKVIISKTKDLADNYVERPNNSVTIVRTKNRAPKVPTLLRPIRQKEVKNLNTVLSVKKSDDPDGDPVYYKFIISKNKSFSKIHLAGKTKAKRYDKKSVEWKISPKLEDNTLYYWKAYASDGHLKSARTKSESFFVNLKNDPPSAPVTKSPSDGQRVLTLRPRLKIIKAVDVDDSTIFYDFEVAADAAYTTVMDSAYGLKTTYWKTNQLSNNTTYYWRSRAKDDEGLHSNWANSSFTINLK